MPLRESNRLLLAAGYAPGFQARPLDDTALAAARLAVDRVLKGHAPYPALAVDRHSVLVAANAALAPLLEGVAPGCSSRPSTCSAWPASGRPKLHQQYEATAEPAIAALANELRGYPRGAAAPRG